MGRRFKLHDNWYSEHDGIYKKKAIMINPGLTVLVGCNGSGKSTMIMQMQQSLKNNRIPYVSFNGLQDGTHNTMDRASYYENWDLVFNLMMSSEGQGLLQSVTVNASKIGRAVRKVAESGQEEKELWIFYDAVDSGLSIDAIVYVKDFLVNTVLKQCQEENIIAYIVVAANSFEMCRHEQSLCARTGRRYVFKTYERYRNFILDMGEEIQNECKDSVN